MREEAVALLRCPHCHGALTLSGSSLVCGLRHSFDIARQGYVPLLAGPLGGITGDSADMVDARERFFAGGHYLPLVRAVVAAANPDSDGAVVDIGAGTGTYLRAVLNACDGRVGFGIDVSKSAVRRLARAHPSAVAVLADAWNQIPVGDGVAAVAICVFAPRNIPETARVLAPSGRFVVVTPSESHLSELTALPGVLTVESSKLQRLDAAAASHFDLVDRSSVSFELRLRRAEVVDLLQMGPTARHLSAAGTAEAVAAFDEPVAVTVSATVSVFERTEKAES